MILESVKPVVENSKHVRINRQRLCEVCAALRREDLRMPVGGEDLGFFDGTERTVDYALILQSVNFRFWGELEWTFMDDRGNVLRGYEALKTAFAQAVWEGIPLLDSDYLAGMSRRDLARILAGSTEGVEIPALDERLGHLHEVGRVLKQRYDGHFYNAVRRARGSAVELVRLVVSHFPCFNDVASYEGREVRFYKRAQLLAGSLYAAFGGRGWGAFGDIDQLTVFPDYRLPQVLRQWGVLEYNHALSQKVDALAFIKAGSPEEVEIRANTVWAAQLMREELSRRLGPVNSIQLDYCLWLEGEKASPGGKPHHRTETVFY